MKKKIATLLIVAGLSIFTLVGCSGLNNNDAQQSSATEQIQIQSSAKLGMPNIKNFYEKQVLKNVMEACDNANLITYVYLKSDYTGKLVYYGQAIGYPVPYGTEYTNPERPLKNGETSMTGNATIPQADPNGLYKATNVNATWIMLIDETTKKANPMFCEPEMVVYSAKLPKRMLDQTSLPSDY